MGEIIINTYMGAKQGVGKRITLMKILNFHRGIVVPHP